MAQYAKVYSTNISGYMGGGGGRGGGGEMPSMTDSMLHPLHSL